MIASERSLLAPAHQSQQQKKSTTIGNPRNGATKPPVRPVKIYVIDPRKLQQRLEAYVDQKNQKQTEAEAKTKERLEKEKQEKEKPSTSTSIKPSSSVSGNLTTSRQSPPKVLPVLAPKLPPTTSNAATPQISTITSTVGLNPHKNTILGNGVTLQSLPCINAASLGLPALPLVVTNGVALIQPPISSQSSMPTGGLFLPGITAIPSVVTSDGTFLSTSQPQQHFIKKLSAPPKRKPKKKKAAKKRKAVDIKEKDDDNDGELKYLLKETTTRAGRISRPLSQPHSPSVATVCLSTSSSRAPSPNSKLKNKLARKEEPPSGNLRDGSSARNEDDATPKFMQCQGSFSTNTNVQGPAASSLSPPYFQMGSTDATASTRSIQHQCTTETASITSQKEMGGDERSSSTLIVDNYKSSEKSRGICNTTSTLSENVQTTMGTANISISTGESFSIGQLSFSASVNGQVGSSKTSNISTCITSIDNDNTGVNASLVPTGNEHQDLLISRSSSIVQVPSSYSIPSSPPSQCHSPGLPESIFGGGNGLLEKRGIDSSPVQACNSPVDPMLLRSRSPFPPPIPETSSHSVGASNLSIPEESLCKGELFMDLGESVLENTSLSNISPTPFCNHSLAIEELFCNDSGMKEPSQELQQTSEETLPDQEDGADNDEPEPRDVSPSNGNMLLEATTEDANDGEIFQTANYARTFLRPANIPSLQNSTVIPNVIHGSCGESTNTLGRIDPNSSTDMPRTPQSVYMESDVSMDSSSEIPLDSSLVNQRCRSIWHFVKDQIKFRGINQVGVKLSSFIFIRRIYM